MIKTVTKIIRWMFRFAAWFVLYAKSIFTFNYGIKRFYLSNPDSKDQFLPSQTIGNSSFYQREVYQHARKLIESQGLKSVLDIGCGTGAKLAEIISPVCTDITGIDCPLAIEICKKKYAFGNWLIENLNHPRLRLNKHFDLIMIADVIEHLENPDHLLNLIKQNADRETRILMSTPERDLLRGPSNFGPPSDLLHIREWNREELKRYLTQRGFIIQEHFLVHHDRETSPKNCQVVCMVCRKSKRDRLKG